MKTSSEKPIGRFPLAILCSLSQGHSMLPYLLFSALAITAPGNADFFVPIVVLYTVQRAALVALRGFGEITNPYRILKGGLILSLIGSLMLVLSRFYTPLEAAGALLIGIGFSSLGAMFRPMFTLLTEKYPACKKSAGLGSIIYLVLALLITVFTSSVTLVIECVFLLYVLAALIVICAFDQNELFENKPAFDITKRKPVFFIFGILILLCLLLMRQYKQSGVSVSFWLVPVVAFAAFIIDAKRDHHIYRHFVYKNYWAGAMKNFLVLFNLLYFSTVGNKSMVTLTLVAITLGGFITDPIAKSLRKRIPANALSDTCVLLTTGLSFLIIVPVNFVNFIVVTLCEALTGIVSHCNASDYLSDDRYLPLERPLTMERVNTIGGVFDQVVLLCSIYCLSKYMVHQDMLLVHAEKVAAPEVAPALRIAGLICCVAMAAYALAAVLSNKRRRKSTQTEEAKA